jgi:phycocyanin beta chain
MVMDAFTKVVAQADARGEYLTDGQLDALIALVDDGNKRLDAVNLLTSKSSEIVTGAARDLFDEQPQLINPGGNAYTNRRAAACLRDLDIILRYITYSIFAGDASVLQDRALNGLRETYLALGVPGSSVALGIQKMRVRSILIIENSPTTDGVTPDLPSCQSLIAEIAGYFDLAALAVG